MRVTTAFNRVLNLPGAWVGSVSFTDQGIVIGLRRRGQRLRCPCGQPTRARYDTSRRRWRHLDFGACMVWLEADVHRLDCRACGRVRTEQVPWARPGARHSRDFEDLAAWLAVTRRSHDSAVPFENLDIMLGRGTSIDLGTIQNKIVRRRRDRKSVV